MAIFQFVSPKEAKEAKRIVNTPLTVKTNASIDDVKRAINSGVRADPDASTLSILSAKLYTHSKSDNKIVYACGNKVNTKMFVAELSFTQEGEQVTSNFRILSHYEQKGTVIQIDFLNQLRRDVRSALMTFSSSNIVSE